MFMDMGVYVDPDGQSARILSLVVPCSFLEAKLPKEDAGDAGATAIQGRQSWGRRVSREGDIWLAGIGDRIQILVGIRAGQTYRSG